MGRACGRLSRGVDGRMKADWVVELTVGGAVRAVRVYADTADDAKRAAETKHPTATRTYGAYTIRQWAHILRLTRADDRRAP